MIEFSLNHYREYFQDGQISQVEVFGNNIPAIKAYEKLGYAEGAKAISDPTTTIGVLPYFEKIQMKKFVTI
jgi:hypothetical protein